MIAELDYLCYLKKKLFQSYFLYFFYYILLLEKDESVFNQLVYGIRHLDLRIAYKDKDFIITHDKFHINHSLSHVLDQILKFIEMSKMEVVIVDFHRYIEKNYKIFS